MGCCRDLAERFVLVISGFMLIFSLVALGFSAYLGINFRDEFETLELDSPVIGAASVGGLLLVFSIVGILGAYWDNKYLLLIYLLGCFALSFGIVVIGVVVLSQLGAFDNVTQAQNLNDEVEELVQLFALASFDSCCAQNNGNSVDCGTFLNDDLCIDGVNDVEREEEFDAIQEAFFGNDPVPECDRFDDLGFDVNDNCIAGQADPTNYVDEFTSFLEENLRLVGIANLIAGIIMLFLNIATCVLIWNSRDKDRNENPDKQENTTTSL